MNFTIVSHLIFTIVYKCVAYTGYCTFSAKEFTISGFNTSNFYTCDFISEEPTSREISTIKGIHVQFGERDEHVRLIHILRGNKIVKFPSILCQKFRSIQVIWSENEGITTIDQSLLMDCRNLEYLEISDANINEIPSETFTYQGNLKELELPRNDIETLYSNSFYGLQNVKTLNLANNKILDLPINTFSPLKNLQTINLNDNRLITIRADSFSSHDNFETVSILRNQIASIDPQFINEIFFGLLEVQDNICVDTSFYRTKSTEIAKILSKCFANYKPRNFDQPILLPPREISSQTDTNRIISSSFLPNDLNLLPPTETKSQNMTNSEIKNSLFLPKLPEDSTKQKKPTINSNQNENQRKNATVNCGRPKTGHGDIIGGKKAIRGNFPWIAALIYSETGKYFCGGSLVTNRKVVTAAHCIQEKHSSKITLPNEFLVLLGVYDLDKSFEAGRTTYAVQNVKVHPDWNIHTEAYDADIAVIILDNQVFFNNYIQPVCAVFQNTNNAAITNAVVVGYGKSEDGTKLHENIPKILDTPIHTHKECFEHNDILKRISSGRTICGGTGNGVGVCKGDSGSGLYVFNGDTYSIRGIVSSSVIGGQYGCDVDTYAVFTDLTKYVDWINGVSTSRF